MSSFIVNYFFGVLVASPVFIAAFKGAKNTTNWRQYLLQ